MEILLKEAQMHLNPGQAIDIICHSSHNCGLTSCIIIHKNNPPIDVYNTGKFQLPDPAGRAGGACTSALLQVLYKDGRAAAGNMSWVECLRAMRSNLRAMGFDQVPQLTSSRMIDVVRP